VAGHCANYFGKWEVLCFVPALTCKRIFRRSFSSFPFRIFLSSLFRLSILLLMAVSVSPDGWAQFYHDPHRKEPIGFSVDLPISASGLSGAVSRVVSSGTIEGSHIYKGDQDIEDAVEEKSSDAFSDNPGSGQVFYKVRTKALAPAHFPASDDMGTVTVRYVVSPINELRCRLRIDAVFITDAGHVRFFSDGSVETAEYAVIMDQVRSAMPSSLLNVKPSDVNTADKSAGLQYDLAQERAMLADAQAAEKKLEGQLKQLQFDTEGRIGTDGIPLKSNPYNHSSTILRMKIGQIVTVLSTSKYWYRVRTESGEEGWIYYLFLEPVS
jgi:hypothetical protein